MSRFTAPAAPAALELADLYAMYEDPAYGGYGFLGGRLIALDDSDAELPAQPGLVALVDDLVLAHANAEGWSRDQLFAWANSKVGRWAADYFFGGSYWMGDPAPRWLWRG